MSVLEHASFFHRRAVEGSTLAISIAKSKVSLSFSPYSSASIGVQSLVYPVNYLLNAAANILKIIQGCGLLLAACFSSPLESVPHVVLGLGHEFGSFLINILNSMISVISLITRTIASIVSLCFVRESYEPEQSGTELQPAEITSNVAQQSPINTIHLFKSIEDFCITAIACENIISETNSETSGRSLGLFRLFREYIESFKNIQNDIRTNSPRLQGFQNEPQEKINALTELINRIRDVLIAHVINFNDVLIAHAINSNLVETVNFEDSPEWISFIVAAQNPALRMSRI